MLKVEMVDFFIFPRKDKRHQAMALLADCSEDGLDAVLRVVSIEAKRAKENRARR